MKHWLLVFALLLAGASNATADTPLQSGMPQAVTFSNVGYITNLYIDVGATAKQLQVNLAASGGDVDMFVRYGSPFPAQGGAQLVSEDLLNRYAHYHSISGTSDESIVVLPSSRVPLRAGRWYIALFNGSSASANGNVTATTSTALPQGNIALDFQHPFTDASDHTNDCDDSFWTDTAAATPVAGNNATTLGEQRKNALIYATQQLAQQLQMTASITVHACGAHLGGDENSAILAHAAPTSYFLDEPSFPINPLPKKYTWYPAAAVVNLNGTSLCGFAGGDCDGVDSSGFPNNEEIEITFNEDIGSSTVIGGESFYLGYQPDTSAQSIDFVTIAMHEMTHGLGFFGLANTDSTIGPLGAKAGITQNSIAYTDLIEGPFDDIYDDSVAMVSGSSYTPFMGYEVNGSGDAARAAALVSGPTITQAGHYDPGIYTGLRWSDPAAVTASVNIHNAEVAPNDFPSLYAPCDKSKTTTCATQPSSTLSHTVQAGDMMNAYYSRFNLRNMGLAAPMLGPVGWSTAVAQPPVYTQPIPSNWFDRSHSGHGFDFQLAAHDTVNGQDVYFLTFYSYAADGTPEWYQAAGRLIDGVFVPDVQADGETLYRIVYDSSVQGGITKHADPACKDTTQHAPCSIVVDFNQAANSPVCRNVDRSGVALLGVMTWSIGSDSGSWCVEPIVPLAAHASPDYNGHWFAASDGGWGFELLDVKTTSAPVVVVYVYYPGPGGQPAWATGSGNLNGNTLTMDLLQVTNGYCRTCPPPAQSSASSIGSMTLSLTPGAGGQHPTGTASINTNTGFNRSNIPITTLSVPTGQ